MYLNLNYMDQKDLFWEDIICLQLAKQQKFQDCTKVLQAFEERVDAMIELGWLKRIKGTKVASDLSKVRITKEGEELLANVETPELLEEDVKIFEWMKSIYLGKEKKLGNQKRTKMLIALFRVQAGIDKNKLVYLATSFVNDDRNMEFNNILEYCFHKPINVYSTRFQLEESRLYNYYMQHQAHFDAKFETL